jgi:hypothetical protein
MGLLHGPHKVLLVREAQGPLAGFAARWVFGLRALSRLTIAAVLQAPGLGGVRSRHPRAADMGNFARDLLWTIAPAWTFRRYAVPSYTTGELARSPAPAVATGHAARA